MLNTEDVNVGTLRPARKLSLLSWITARYTRPGLWSLFLTCVFPLHAWALILAFRDVSWVTERTNAWDAVGVVSYGLLFTLVETVLVFALLVLLGYLVSTHWDVDHRVALLGFVVLIASVWAILAQLFFLLQVTLPSWFIAFLVANSHPRRTLYMVVLALIGVTVAVPTWFVLRSRRGFAFMRGLMDRLSILSFFYLFLDVVGVVIVVIRNL